MACSVNILCGNCGSDYDRGSSSKSKYALLTGAMKCEERTLLFVGVTEGTALSAVRSQIVKQFDLTRHKYFVCP